MKNNQFAIVPTDLATRKQELSQLHLLKDNDQKLTPTELWLTLLTRINPAIHTQAAAQSYLNSLLAYQLQNGSIRTSHYPTRCST